jgi:hypothetical protein
MTKSGDRECFWGLVEVSTFFITFSTYQFINWLSNPKLFFNCVFVFQVQPLRNLISYLKMKEAAGVIAINYSDDQHVEHQRVLYCFPPCDFVTDLVKIFFDIFAAHILESSLNVLF